MQEYIDTTFAQFSETISDLTTERDMLQELSDELGDSIQGLSDELLDSRASIEKQKIDINHYKQQNDELNGTLEEYRTRIDKLKKAVELQKSKISNLANDNESLKAENENTTSELNIALEDFAKLKTKFVEQLQSIKQKMGEVRLNHEQETKVLNDKIESIEGEKQSLEQRLEEYIGKNQAKSVELKAQKESYEQQIRDINARNEEDRATLREELVQLGGDAQKQLEKLTNDLESSNAKHKEESQLLRSTIKDLTNDLDRVRNDYNTMKHTDSAYQKLKEAHEALRSELADKEKDYYQLDQTKESLARKIQTLETSLDDKEKSFAKTEEKLKAQLQSVQTQQSKADPDEIISIRATLSETEDKLEESIKQYKATSEKNITLEKEIATLKLKVTSLEKAKEEQQKIQTESTARKPTVVSMYDTFILLIQGLHLRHLL